MIDVKVKEMEDSRAENTALSVTKKGSTFTLERGKAEADAMDFMLAVYEYMISAALALSENATTGFPRNQLWILQLLRWSWLPPSLKERVLRLSYRNS